MDPVWWIVIFVVGLPIAWFAFKATLGAVVPPEVSGKLLLKQRLAHYGADPSRLPDACLQELAETSVQTAKMTATVMRESWREQMVNSIEGTAVLVAKHLHGEDEKTFGDSWTKDVLRRHGVVQ